MKVSSKFRWIWTSFAQDSPFEALFSDSLGEVGLTGLEIQFPAQPPAIKASNGKSRANEVQI